jgi:hypothetical protein
MEENIKKSLGLLAKLMAHGRQSLTILRNFSNESHFLILNLLIVQKSPQTTALVHLLTGT